MTAGVLLNRVGTDIVDLSVNQVGSEEATVILRDSLLDDNKDYRFAVTSLSVPMQNIDMFGFLTVPTQELFTIQRRTVRAQLTDRAQQQNDFDTDVALGTVVFGDIENDIQQEEQKRSDDGQSTFNDDGTQSDADRIKHMQDHLLQLWTVVPFCDWAAFSSYNLLRGRKFYDVNQFVKSLSDFAREFNKGMLATGIDDIHFGGTAQDKDRITGNNMFIPGTLGAGAVEVADYEFLKIFLTTDGNLIFSMDRFFIDNFIIRFTNIGAAILGIDTDILTERALTVSYDVVNDARFRTVAGLIEPGHNNYTIQSLCPVSVFQSAECRIRISVESHLPVQSSIEIRDEKETNNREITNAFFLNDVKVNCVWSATGSLENYAIESKVFTGQLPLIHQNSRILQWNRLLTSYNLQFFRFFLNVHYRYFDDIAGLWKILVKRVTVAPADYWDMKIRFVSDE